MVRVVVDADGGVDDCVALWWALDAPELDVVAVVATAGVVGVEQAARNAAKVLAAAGRPDVPLALGLGHPAPGPSRHGRDGLGDCGLPDAPVRPVAEPGPALLSRLAAGRPGELTVVTLGPLSTLAAAVRADPALPGRVGALVCMGGDFNLGTDAEAAGEVARAAWPASSLLVSLHAGFSATLGERELAALERRATPQAAFFACPVAAYARATRPLTPGGGCPCHDAVAMAAAALPGAVSVEDHPPWRVATSADGDLVRARLRAFFDPAA